MSSRDSYIPPVLNPSRSFTPRSIPTVRPTAAEAEALAAFEEALRTDEWTARLENVAVSVRGGR